MKLPAFPVEGGCVSVATLDVRNCRHFTGQNPPVPEMQGTAALSVTTSWVWSPMRDPEDIGSGTTVS
jgi:hypothetical protein